MNLRKATCLDGTSYKVGEVMAKGTVKEIFIKYLTYNLIEIQVKTSTETIHIPYHAVLLYIEE